MFKKNDYIVLTGPPLSNVTKDPLKFYSKNNGFKIDYVYKQRKDDHYLCPYFDNSYNTANGWMAYDFEMDNWRYATIDEKTYYDQIGGPFDIMEYRRTRYSTLYVREYNFSLDKKYRNTYLAKAGVNKGGFIIRPLNVLDTAVYYFNDLYFHDARMATTEEIEAYNAGYHFLHEYNESKLKVDNYSII